MGGALLYRRARCRHMNILFLSRWLVAGADHLGRRLALQNVLPTSTKLRIRTVMNRLSTDLPQRFSLFRTIL